MTKRTRTLLFFLCVAFFLILSPVFILYSQGYRFDLEAKKFAKIGAFFFKVWPKSAEIYLNGRLVKKTDFFFGTALIEDLLPKKYFIEIRKEGFLPWKKSLEIKEGLVAEAKNIVLFPEKPIFKELTQGVKEAFFSPSGEKAILKKEDRNGWYLTIFDVKNNLEKNLVEEKRIFRKGSSFLGLQWSADSKKAILRLASEEAEKNFLLDPESPISPLTSLDWLGILEKISFQNNDSGKFFVLKDGVLKTGDFNSKALAADSWEDVLTFSPQGNDVFILDKQGFIFKINPLLKLKEKVNETAFPVQLEAEYHLLSSTPYLFLQENKDLFFFNREKNGFEKLGEKIEGTETSPDFRKLAYFNKLEIWILLLDNPKFAGEKILLSRFSEGMGNPSWLNNDYLIFNIGDKIKIVEIDNRDMINIIDFAEFKNPQIFLGRTSKKIFFLTEEQLSSVERFSAGP